MNRCPRPARSRGSLLLVLLLAAGLLAADARAQLITATPGVSAYRYAEDGRPTMSVRVWGGVRTPGLYTVERETDLLALLTLAGGPAYYVDAPNTEHTVTVRIARGSDHRDVVFERPLEELLRAATPPPPLQDGDVVTVDTELRVRIGWREVLGVVSSVGTLAIIALQIVQLSR